MQLHDIKINVNHMREAFGLLEEMIFDLKPGNSSPAAQGQISVLQGLVAVLGPFIDSVAKDLERFPGDIEADE